MKLFIPILFFPFLLMYMPFFITLMSISMIFIIMKMMEHNQKFSMNFMMHWDYLSFALIMLSMMSCLLIFLSSNNFSSIFPMISSILILLTIFFSLSNMFSFYIMFETILIPTFILITNNGKQPERLQAGIYLLIYTITTSLPLILGILYFKKYSEFIFSTTSCFSINIFLIFIMAFLVKLPMFSVHLWLPKAHVEAPLEGSMILAAILLKMGGFGLIRFIPIITNKMSLFSQWISSISLIGAMATSMNCIRQKDMKSLIAYSSVAHMGLILASIMTLNPIGLTGAVILMIAHGFSSSALFLLVNLIYSKYHSRNIISFKGLISTFPNLTFWWFMFLAINISIPPSINTISEIFIMMSLINWNHITMIMIFFISIMTSIFSINMFINISHNYPNLNFSEDTNMKNFLSLFLHLIFLFILIMKIETMS